MGNLTVRSVGSAIINKATEQSAGKLTVIEEERDFFEYTCGVLDDFINEIEAYGFDVEFENTTKEILITIVFLSFEVFLAKHPIYDIMRRANKIKFEGSKDGGSVSMTLYLPGVWRLDIE